MARRLFLLDALLILVCVTVVLTGIAYGREVWVDQSFKMETGGWFRYDEMTNCSELQVGLTVSERGMMLIYGDGALEVYIPHVGWVQDRGILVLQGCAPDRATVQNTMTGPVTVTSDLGCAKEAGRVLMFVRVPGVLNHTSTLPTKARWVPRREHHYEAAQ